MTYWQLLFIFAYVIVATILLSGCTNETEAQRAVENLGLEVVSVGGYGMFACSEDDMYSTKFVAKREDGTVVTGVVCSGMFFKGATVRFD